MDPEKYAMVQLILDLGADIDAKDSLGMTAAFHAVTNESSRILALLLDRGADPYVLTKKRESLVHLAANSPTSAMLDYLIDSGASFDTADEEGLTPLMNAAGMGQMETLTALIKRGARCDTTNSKGKSLLHFAILAPNPEPDVVKVVMQTQSVNVIDIKGRTPLHYAYLWSAQNHCKVSMADVIQLLIEGGAAETIVDAYGRVAKDYVDWSTDEHERNWGREYWDLTYLETEQPKQSHDSQAKGVNQSTASLEPVEESERKQQEAF